MKQRVTLGICILLVFLATVPSLAAPVRLFLLPTVALEWSDDRLVVAEDKESRKVGLEVDEVLRGLPPIMTAGTAQFELRRVDGPTASVDTALTAAAVGWNSRNQEISQFPKDGIPAGAYVKPVLRGIKEGGNYVFTGAFLTAYVGAPSASPTPNWVYFTDSSCFSPGFEATKVMEIFTGDLLGNVAEARKAYSEDLLAKIRYQHLGSSEIRVLLESWMLDNAEADVSNEDRSQGGTEEALRFLYANSLALSGDVDRGLKILRVVLDRHSGDRELQVIAGNTCFSLARYADAASYYEVASKLDRGSYSGLGDTVLRAVSDGPLKDLFFTASQNNFTAGNEAATRLAESYLRAGMYDRAADAAKTETEGASNYPSADVPGRVNAWFLYMEALRAKGDPKHLEVAKKLFEVARETIRRASSYNSWIAETYADFAQRIVTRLEQDQYPFSGILLNAENYARKGDYDKALALYRDALKNEPNNLEVYDAMLRIYRYNNKDEASVEALFTEGIRSQAKNARFYMIRAVARYRLKKWDDALADFTKAGALDSARVAVCQKWITRVKALRASARQANAKLTVELVTRNPKNYVGGVVNWTGKVDLLEETKTDTLVYVDVRGVGVALAEALGYGMGDKRYCILRAKGQLPELEEGALITFVGKIAGPGAVHLTNGRTVTVPLVDNWAWFEAMEELPTE